MLFLKIINLFFKHENIHLELKFLVNLFGCLSSEFLTVSLNNIVPAVDVFK